MGSGAGANELSYDLFLSYNSVDHRVVGEVAHKLANGGFKEVFLDGWNLLKGMRRRPMLEKALSSSKAVAIFAGPGEMGSWQQREVDIALNLQSKSANLPVIPVLLRGCEPPLGFLRQLTWVDLRTQTLDRGIAILIKAATGKAPDPDLQKHYDFVRASICPYRGLLHFREEDAPFFWGRQAAIEGLVEGVKHHPFLALVGTSGSGKPSVLRAGLVPSLRSDHVTTWEFISLVPTYQPYVERAWRHALSLRRETFIRPTYWEDPWPHPPGPLLPIQFQRLEIVVPRKKYRLESQRPETERLEVGQFQLEEKARQVSTRIYRCEKFGGCPIADSRKNIEVSSGSTAACTMPGCPGLLAEVGTPSASMASRGEPRFPWLRIVGAVVLLAIVGGVWTFWRSHDLASLTLNIPSAVSGHVGEDLLIPVSVEPAAAKVTLTSGSQRGLVRDLVKALHETMAGRIIDRRATYSGTGRGPTANFWMFRTSLSLGLTCSRAAIHYE